MRKLRDVALQIRKFDVNAVHLREYLSRAYDQLFFGDISDASLLRERRIHENIEAQLFLIEILQQRNNIDGFLESRIERGLLDELKIDTC